MASKKSELVLTCNATALKDVMNFLNKQLDDLIRKRDQLNAKGVQNWTAQDKKNFKQWGDDIAAINSAMQRNRDEMVKYGQVMKDLAGAKTKDLKRALGEVKRALDNMSARDPGRAQLEADLKKIQRQIDANTVSIKKNQSAWGALGTTMKNLFAYAGIFAGFNLLKSKMTEAYEANKRFSDSMANVRKVSGLTMDEIGKLANNLSKIDSRTGLGGLMELGYTGAKLGFGNYGIEGLESFAKSAVKVQNALSEDMGADSMTALSKMVEVMGLIPKMGVERAMDATGSAIFKLASTSTATGTNIVEFSKRLMGLANIAHITTPELLAIGSAADSMALMPEVAATAFNKLITAVQKQPNLIENALHIEKGTISDMYQAGKMTDALVMIFEKMREKGGMNALMQSGVFKDLGSDGARLVAVMATMANRVDMLNAHLAVSRQAFEEGTAVAQEYAIQMDTAAAYSERAANIWEKAFVNPEGVDTVKEFTKAWYEVSKALTSNKVAMAEVKFLLGGILELLKGILYFLPALLSGLAVLGAGRMFVALRSALEMTRLSAVGLTLSLNGLKTAWTALSAVGKANWIGAAATALFMIIEAFGMFNKKVQEATGYMKGFKKDLGDLNVEYGKAESELRRYRRAIDEANTGSKQRLAAINTFNSKFKPYLSNLLTEKSTALDVAKAYNEVTKAIRAKLALQLKEKDIEKYVAPREQWAAERRQEYEKRANEAGKGQYGSTWITGYAQDNRNKTIDTMVRDIGKQYYNLPQQIIDEVSKQAAAGNTSFNNYGSIINSRYLKDANALLAASSYLRQERSAENALRYTNKKWEPEQKLIDDLTAQQEETPYEPLQDAPDKDAIAAAKKAAQDRKKALKLEMDEAQKASTGIISKLEEYYRLQEAAINDARADGQLTEEQAKEMVRALSILKNESLATARRAVTTGEMKNWDKLKTETLPAVMSDTSEVSRNLLETIQQVAVDKLHTDLEKFNGSSDVLGLDSRAFFDLMNAKAAGNTREAARLRAKIQNEVERALMQYQFVEKANQQMRKDLEAMGITTETYEQWAKRMQQGITEKPATVTSSGRSITDQEAYREMGNKFIQQGVINFRYNIENQQEAEQWLNDFATTSAGKLEDWAQAFPELMTWIDLIKRKEKGETLGEVELQTLQNAMPRIKNLYDEMLNHADRVNKAMKQAYEHEKTQQDIRFQVAGYRKQESEADSAWESIGKQKESGINASFWEQQGLGSVADDPEVQRIQNRIYWRNQELLDAQNQFEQRKILNEQEIQALKDRNASEAEIEALRLQQKQDNAGIEELINEKQTQLFNETSNLSAKVAQELQKRVQAVNTLVKPVETAAKNIGQKLGDMIFDMESQSMTWEEIWKNMALAVAESMLSMAGQYAQNAIVKASMNRAEETEEGAHATVMTMFGISEGAAKTIGTLGWIGIALIPVITALLMGLLTSALSTSRNDNGNTAAAKNTKLVSGMLTYDKGNVDKFAGRRKLYDDGETQVYGRRRYLGEDGKVYTATAEPAPKDGLVTHPIATTVQGQPALVAENGPEIVIGRETTKAIMMNEPELIKYLANYQQHGARRLFDSGNVQSVAATQPSDISPQTSDIIPQTSDTAAERQALINRLDRSDALMEQVLYFLQHPVRPKINMYSQGGEDGLYDSMKKATAFMAKHQ